MAAAAFIVADCSAARGNLGLQHRLQFMLGQSLSGYFYSEDLSGVSARVLRAGFIQHSEQASQCDDRRLVACFHGGAQVHR
jgi:hypothetical protein